LHFFKIFDETPQICYIYICTVFKFTGLILGNFGEDLNKVNIPDSRLDLNFVLQNLCHLGSTFSKKKTLKIGGALGERPGSNRRPLVPQTSALTS
jgi:hypothetical protein